jgi:hypothetical protein
MLRGYINLPVCLPYEFQLPDHDLTDIFPNQYTSEMALTSSCILNLHRNYTNTITSFVFV